jgi:hypothetical protein
LIIHHLKAFENLSNLQLEYLQQLLADKNIVTSSLGGDVDKLICSYLPLETQGFFATKSLRQLPEEKPLNLQSFLATTRLSP